MFRDLPFCAGVEESSDYNKAIAVNYGLVCMCVLCFSLVAKALEVANSHTSILLQHLESKATCVL